MIRKLRVKFVAICMALVTLVLGAVFFSVVSATGQNIRANTMEVLERVIGQEGSVGRPSAGGPTVQMPYFTVAVMGSTAYITGGTYSDLENTTELQEIITIALRGGASTGVVAKYSLRYLIEDNGLYQRMAFADMSIERSIMEDLLRSSFQIGIAAFLVLFAVSCLLAWWATRPVEQAMRQQRQFLSDASHELKTPLTVILSNAEMLSAAHLEERSARWADNIHSEAGQMKTLVEEMLTLARSDNMGRTAILTEQDLSALVTDCSLSFEPVAFEHGKQLEWESVPGTRVLGDGDQLRRLVGVLLDNAVKYGAPGAPIRVSLSRDDKRARLEVSNQGPVIPPEQLRRLFERFYRADDSRGEKSGFGLGLPIAAAIAAEHKGTIRAESDQRSTRFIVSIPLKK
ncbi:HAMP domain-containing histidine kinase [Oscillibacter sp. MSJ-2]|uniref:histidine kinase n=2 Tax=Dysosmobacter acutus TaxID=2841504 RepID=A0ABS6F8B2_9FIRM|nr:HAMP domain-containing histidine kinase [Dysosmobacter acutus]